MNRKKLSLLVIASMIIGAVIGYFIYANIVARYVAITTACVTIMQGVKSGIIAEDQVVRLGQLTGAELKAHYTSVGNKLKVTETQLKSASEASQCSQFIVGINQAQ